MVLPGGGGVANQSVVLLLSSLSLTHRASCLLESEDRNELPAHPPAIS